MLKIDERLKLREMPKYVNEQLSFIDTINIKFMVAVYVFLMLDLFMFGPLFFPFVTLHLYILLPPLIILNLWATWILVRNPYSVQYEMILLLAAIGVYGSLAYLILAHKLAYYFMSIHDWSYYVIVTLLYLLTTLWILRYRLSRFKDLSYEALKEWHMKEQRKFSGKEKKDSISFVDKCIGVILYVPAVGYFIAQGIKYGEVGVGFILILSYLSFACLFSYIGIKFTHRILIMKANPQFVHLPVPSKIHYRKGMVKRGLKIK